MIAVKPGFHWANYDHDNDQLRVKTKRLAWRMTAQPIIALFLCCGRGICRVMETTPYNWRHVSSLVSSCIANLNQRDMAKQLLTPLRLIARMSFSLKNYSCELFNLTETVGKVELISTFITTAVCESWNVSNKYTWDNAGDLSNSSWTRLSVKIIGVIKRRNGAIFPC